MNDLNNTIKSWWQKISTKEASYEKKSIRPGHDWTVIFLSTQVIIFLCALGAFYFYKQVDGGTYFSVTRENTENEVKININLLKKTVDDINFREENLAETKTGNIAPRDPSR